MPDRRLRAVRDDHVVGQLAAVLLGHRLHRRAHLLGGEPVPQLVDQRRARRPSPRRRPSARAGCPSSSDADLTRRRRGELVVVDRQLDAVGAQVVGDEERELRRHRGLRDAELLGRRAARSRPRAAAGRGPRRSGRRCRASPGSMISMPCSRHLRGVQHARRSPRGDRRSRGTGTGRRCRRAPRGTASPRSRARRRSGRRWDHLQARQHRRDVAHVVAVVEDLVEVDVHILLLEQRRAAASACPTPAGRAAGRSGTRRRAAARSTTSASSTRWENSAPDVISRFASIRSAWTVIPRTTRSASARIWSSRIVESGRMIRSAEECVMSRSCHSATFSSPTWALPRRTRARPQIRSLTTGLRLCGIALEPFWPLPNGSSTSRTSVRCRWRISVAKRSRPAPRQRDRGQKLRVAIARDDLRGDGLVAAGRASRRRAPRSPGRASRRCRPRRRSPP